MRIARTSPPSWLRLAAAVAALVVISAACGPQPSQSSDGATAPPSSAKASEAAASPSGFAVKAPAPDDLVNPRDLSGKITVATQGALVVPGAPATRQQQAWEQVLAAYKAVQPNVEIETIDLPATTDPSEWCTTKRSAGQLPDLMVVGNCDYFRPTKQEIDSGTAVAADFTKFTDEISPYSGKPWRESWMDDSVRLTRCQEGGAVEQWTCMTNEFEVKPIFVNWDILKEYGVTEFPETLTELWALSNKINADGKYAAWDNESDRYRNYRNAVASLLAMDEYQKMGGDLSNLKVNPWTYLPNYAEGYCNGSLRLQGSPAMQEVIRQTKLFVDANGGGASFFDPTREFGTQWVQGKAAMFWGSSQDQALISQAQADGVFNVPNWSLEFFPDLRTEDLVDKSLPISFDGKFYIFYAHGLGDTFAPLPEVRTSGADENVDLIVRDFLQFLTSKYGQEGMLVQQLLPVNPDVMAIAPELWQGAVAEGREVDKLYQSSGQAPGSFMNALAGYDPEGTEVLYYSDGISFEDFVKAADERVTVNIVAQLRDSLAQWGLTEVPADCVPYLR